MEPNSGHPDFSSANTLRCCLASFGASRQTRSSESDVVDCQSQQQSR
jgi:hypothetical protein